ncbi:MAG: hypothetical protein VBE63_28355 [Lamprobacter sp.]|uniref:hypothetical protein n=1 Tax=Lamprobacter sp. TaxID=3100796 RepID=UPI002B25D138|nr:hypothetical protein [Lamprobacter sp.]MEA3643807.1 hypothetical protein [Lamprobacter sp.]
MPPTSLLAISSLVTCSLFTWLLACPTTGLARDYRINVGQLPLYAETKGKGILIDVIKAMDEEYEAGSLIIEVYPFERSIHKVAQGLEDAEHVAEKIRQQVAASQAVSPVQFTLSIGLTVVSRLDQTISDSIV